MITRRKVLKNGTALTVGAVYSGSLISVLTGCSSSSDSNDEVEVLAGGLMVVRPSLCVGCRRCEIGCCWSHGDSSQGPELSRVKVERNMNFGPHGVQFNYHDQHGQVGNRNIVPQTCRQCDVCMTVCPQQAISVNETTGARVVDESLCVGCGYCADHCPQQVITIDKRRRTAQKCDLCEGEPACAQMCPTGAMRFYSWADAEAAIEHHDIYLRLI
ncbi:4Fe-4S dicluster domain-containing protein [Ferrimonas balearica]|nr:4Fe-4S dicluster domain-containing protein [Ferrimonas balearica]